jgi:peroxiredoxin Q/BCP
MGKKGLGGVMALAAEGLAAGDKAPSFKIATDSGETVTSASLKGAPYIVYFYPKDDTSGCTKEAIDFLKIRKIRQTRCHCPGRLQGQRGEPREVPQKTQTENRAGFRSGNQNGERLGRVGRKDAVWPKIYGHGTRDIFGRWERVIKQAWHKVKVPGHVEAVLQAAEEL